MSKILIKQIKSTIGKPKLQKDTIIALGLGKINQTKEHKDTSSIRGMVNKVHHLIEVKKI